MRPMTWRRAETLLELMHQIEHFTLARAWGNLTDDEFFWEPFTTAWSIRRHDQSGQRTRSEPANGSPTSRSLSQFRFR